MLYQRGISGLVETLSGPVVASSEFLRAPNDPETGIGSRAHGVRAIAACREGCLEPTCA